MCKRIFTLITALCFFSSICLSQNSFIPFNDSRISYEGRVMYNENSAILSWSGTSIRINFTGTTIHGLFKDADTANYYNVIVNHRIVSKFHFDTIQKKYTLANDLSFGKHSLQIFKRTEWDKGKTFFYGFEIPSDQHLLKPSKLPKRKMEVFGNSITCGYAIEDTVGDSYVGYYENNYDSYAAITARHFNAQYHCTAKSGIGIVISWFPLLMSEMYDRLDPTDSSSKWNFKNYTPNVVVINLLQNDSWLVNMPNNDQFKKRFGNKAPSDSFINEAYKRFIITVRNKYPKASIICMLGNMDITRKGSKWPSFVENAVNSLNDKKIFTFVAPFKETGGHPKTNEQKVLASQLIAFIDEHIKW